MSVRTLSRAWQILLKGIPEVQTATRPLAAAEMVLVRLAYAADLPTAGRGPARPARRRVPARRTERVGAGAGAPGRPVLAPAQRRSRPAGRSAPRPLAASRRPAPRLRRFEDVVALAGERREIALKNALERDVRLVRFDEGRIEFALAEGGSRTFAERPHACAARLDRPALGRGAVVRARRRRRCASSARPRSASARSDAAGHPLVQAVLSRFPGAEIVDVRDARERRPPVEAEAAPPADPEADEDR